MTPARLTAILAAADAAEKRQANQQRLSLFDIALHRRDLTLLIAGLRELAAEVERYRKILAYVPSRIALEAKEKAGFGDTIHTKE